MKAKEELLKECRQLLNDMSCDIVENKCASDLYWGSKNTAEETIGIHDIHMRNIMDAQKKIGTMINALITLECGGL